MCRRWRRPDRHRPPPAHRGERRRATTARCRQCARVRLPSPGAARGGRWGRHAAIRTWRAPAGLRGDDRASTGSCGRRLPRDHATVCAAARAAQDPCSGPSPAIEFIAGRAGGAGAAGTFGLKNRACHRPRCARQVTAANFARFDHVIGMTHARSAGTALALAGGVHMLADSTRLDTARIGVSADWQTAFVHQAPEVVEQRLVGSVQATGSSQRLGGRPRARNASVRVARGQISHLQ